MAKAGTGITKWDTKGADLVRRLGILLPNGSLEARVAWLYRILDTLDQKAASLLSFDSFILAAQTLLAGAALQSGVSSPVRVTLVLLLLVPLASAASTVRVFRVKWAWLRHLEGTTPDEEITNLAQECAKRSSAVGWSWRLSIAAAGAFVATGALYLCCKPPVG